MSFCSLVRLLSRVALVGSGEFFAVPSGGLHCIAQLQHLRSLLLIGRRYVHGRQMTQRIDRHMQVRTCYRSSLETPVGISRLITPNETYWWSD